MFWVSSGIGLLYQGEIGIAQSHSTAMSYLEKTEDCCDAFNSLKDVYKYGYERDIDLETAFKYYTISAKKKKKRQWQFLQSRINIFGRFRNGNQQGSSIVLASKGRTICK